MMMMTMMMMIMMTTMMTMMMIRSYTEQETSSAGRLTAHTGRLNENTTTRMSRGRHALKLGLTGQADIGQKRKSKTTRRTKGYMG